MTEEGNIMKMSESELADEIDSMLESLEEKLKGQNKQIVQTIKGAFRMLQLQLNFIKSRADMGVYHYIAHMKCVPEDVKNLIMNDVIKQKDEANEKILREMEEEKAKVSPSQKTGSEVKHGN